MCEMALNALNSSSSNKYDRLSFSIPLGGFVFLNARGFFVRLFSLRFELSGHGHRWSYAALRERMEQDGFGAPDA